MFELATNQTAIGESIIGNSRAINEQIAIREAQRSETNSILQEINNRLSGQVTDLGSAVSDVSSAIPENKSGGFFGGLPNFEQLKTPLIIGGIALGALYLLPKLFKKSRSLAPI